MSVNLVGDLMTGGFLPVDRLDETRSSLGNVLRGNGFPDRGKFLKFFDSQYEEPCAQIITKAKMACLAMLARRREAILWRICLDDQLQDQTQEHENDDEETLKRF
ncbi:Uu.00g035760.m01.CDS01 [Anthostomella pinea]|uniref:Uu.00g035760.m01.CDS01 n=1 Tax=Anthostomella pinea TaxID=933095 RepID=A0AAI8V4E1_9PEZI|nr:Uu.00g035760.m01.CDS01 [Anthostomella pinea]